MKVSRDRRVMAEINVTPFVDIMLVLLIIFMVTAPLMKQGLDINLPQSKGGALKEEERFTVAIKKDGSLYLNGQAITMIDLIAKLKYSSSVNPNVYLEADSSVSYGRVAEVMGEIKAAGIEKLGMVTMPKHDETAKSR